MPQGAEHKSTLTQEQLDALVQRMINRGLEAEMDAHLGYGHGERSESGNNRNGKSRKRASEIRDIPPPPAVAGDLITP